MIRFLSNLFTSALAMGGVFVASVLTWKHFHPEASIGCSTAPGGCGGVLKSAYSHIGFIPTSLFGLAMYVTFLALCFKRNQSLRVLRSQPATLPQETAAEDVGETPPAPIENPAFVASRAELRKLDGIVWGIAITGFVISLWLQYTSIFQLKSFCPWCFSSATLVTLITAFATRDYWLEGRTLDGEQKLVIGVLSGVVALGTLVYLPSIMQAIEEIKHPPNPFEKDPRNQMARALVLNADMHVKGDPKAPILLVEFADFECPSCRETTPLAENFFKSNPGRVKFSYRHFPLARHKWSKKAAVIAEAAAEQGKFWEMKDALFSQQDRMATPVWTEDKFDAIAETVGLDMAKFQKRRRAKDLEDKVNRDGEDGFSLGITSTPTFFVVTEDRVWTFKGGGDLMKAVADKKHGMWQATAPVEIPKKQIGAP